MYDHTRMERAGRAPIAESGDLIETTERTSLAGGRARRARCPYADSCQTVGTLPRRHARRRGGTGLHSMLPWERDELYWNSSITISGFDPRRSGGPQVPAPLEV